MSEAYYKLAIVKDLKYISTAEVATKNFRITTAEIFLGRNPSFNFTEQKKRKQTNSSRNLSLDTVKKIVVSLTPTLVLDHSLDYNPVNFKPIISNTPA